MHAVSLSVAGFDWSCVLSTLPSLVQHASEVICVRAPSVAQCSGLHWPCLYQGSGTCRCAQMLAVVCACMQHVTVDGPPMDIGVGLSLTTTIRKARLTLAAPVWTAVPCCPRSRYSFAVLNSLGHVLLV